MTYVTNNTIGIVLLQRQCPGTIVKRASQLQALRFCTYIDGNLTLAVSDSVSDQDFSVFDGLGEIRGDELTPSCIPSYFSRFSRDYQQHWNQERSTLC